ncbi:hypothetical protein ABFS83_04G045800 [Erythranthe nasuta]
MANQRVAAVTATQVGSYFVQQYYQVFQQQQDYVYRFYTDSSSMVRVDGEIIHSASDLAKIHELIMSLNFTGIEIKTINSIESWNGGVLVVVSGFVKSSDFGAGRKFVQTFFLAPQDKGYFVLNDMFHFADEDVAYQSSVPLAQDNVDYQPTISNHLPDPPVSDYALEEEAMNHVNSIRIEGDDPTNEYNYQEHYQPDLEAESEPEPEPDLEALRREEEKPIEESTALLQSAVTAHKETQPSTEEPVVEPKKFTYASILAVKGKSPSTFVSPPAFSQRAPLATDWTHVSQPTPQQLDPIRSSSLDHAVDEALSLEGESKSVYVKNLPLTVTTLDIRQEFQSFGQIKSDGVFLKNRQDTGICFAFVEFEDLQSVQNAIKASPIVMDGKNVYIEERRPNTGASRGGRRGGRGTVGGRFPGRGSYQNGGDQNRARSNTYRGI